MVTLFSRAPRLWNGRESGTTRSLMKTGKAKSGDVEIAYSVEGDGKETVLLVMGLGGRAADWGTAFPAALAERYRVVRMDNRGVGASPPAPGGYDLSARRP